MKQQVDKLIANVLLVEGEVYLPEVGTLILRRHAAKLLSAKQLQAPHSELVLTKEQRGASILSHISHIANVSEIRANDIYTEWLAQSFRDGILTIGLVCTIANGKVVIDEVFDGIVNQRSSSIVKIKPRKNKFARAMVALSICAVLGAAGYYLYISGVAAPLLAKIEQAIAPKDEVKEIVETKVAETTPIIIEPDTTAIVVAEPDSTLVAINEVVADTTLVVTTEPTTDITTEQTVEQTVEEVPVIEETPAIVETEILELRSTYSYAVWGVYRELKNAKEAILWLADKFPSIEAHIYKYGTRYMVAVYEVESRNACGRQVSKWKAQWKSFKSVWVYTR